MNNNPFLTFTTTLTAALPTLTGKSSPRLRVICDSTKQHAEAGEILIGLGDFEDVFGPPGHQPGVTLQQKGKDSPYFSISELLAHADDDHLAEWRRRLNEPASLTDLQATLYVEDASPDTCLALVFFLARLFGVARDALPADWCDYATRWECGDVRTTGQPFASWGCLHSALGHGFLLPQRDDKTQDETGIEAAFPVCLAYLLGLLAQGVDPAQVPDELPNVKQHLLARLILQRDAQAYQHSLSSAETLQLRLPVQGDRRHLLVDAYIATETTVSGTSKAFIRTDNKHTWFGQGFSVMALYRPLATPGDDITISVDPAAGIHLKQLWAELERLENERWADAGVERPRDNPRKIESYKNGSNPYEGPNQPWWDDHGRCTLLGAPRLLHAGGERGSKLTWSDVREALWSCYQPARDLRFTPYGDPSSPSLPLHECPSTEAGSKRLLIVVWDRHNHEPLTLTPALQRYLAACVGQNHTKGVPLDALPDTRSFDFLHLPGGFAVIHAQGVLLIDDWSNQKLDISAFKEEFTRLVDRLDTVHQLDKDADRLIKRVRDGMEQGEPLPSHKLIQQLAHQRLQLHTSLYATRAQSEDSNVLHFREILEKRWGLAGQLTALHGTLEQLDALVQNHLELRTNRLLNGLTIYGFPAVLFGSFFGGFILEKWSESVSLWDAVHWRGLLLYGVLSGLGSLLLWLVNRRVQRARLSDKTLE